MASLTDTPLFGKLKRNANSHGGPFLSLLPALCPPPSSAKPAHKIALITTELGVGGAERCLYQLAKGLPQPEFSPTVYSLAPRPPAERSELVHGLEEARIPLRFLNLQHVWQVPQTLARLRQEWSANPPDIIQSFLFHADLLAAWAKSSAPQARLVWGIRVADPSWYRHRLRQFLAGRADRVVCVSQAVAEFAHAKIHLPREKLVVIHNGIDPARFDWETAPALLPTAAPAQIALPALPDHPQRSHEFADAGVWAADASPQPTCLPAGRAVILCVARLHRQKGLDWLLHALQPVFAQSPNSDLVLVGSGPERAALEQLASRLQMAERVRFLGWHPDVPRLLRASQLLVLTSRWEGLPNAVLEAMASGIPVVATRTHGVTELLGDDSDQVFAPGDTAGFAARVCRLLQDTAHARQVGERNRHRAWSQFSISQMVAAYVQLYRDLRSERSA